MPYKKLTETGKIFINNIGDKASPGGLLQGNNGLLPFSDTTDANKIWKANVIWTVEDDKRNGTPVTTNAQFTEYIAVLFDLYAEQYILDANIIAAQAYQESRYRCWTYNKNNSTASAISQVVMNTVYEIVINKKWLTDDETNTITNGMTNPQFKPSWRKVLKAENINSDDIKVQEANRSILHQNMIDNPHITIKMQCVLMNFISERNANLASSSLFAYSRGSGRSSDNYIQIINNTARGVSDNYCNEGIKYVEHIFGYLGDKNNEFVTGLDSITKGYSFGYTLDLDKKNWNAFNADSKSDYFPSRSTKSVAAIDGELRIGYESAEVIFNEKYKNTYVVKLNSVYRTPAHQKRLYNVGRTPQGTLNGEGTLTPIDGFNRKSKHNFYFTTAFDFNIFTASNVFLSGKKYPIYRPLYEEFAGYVIDVVPRAVWGGNFVNQKDDVVHIQLN